jgi:hypothetical protein
VSSTGGNSLARDLLAGVFTLPATSPPQYLKSIAVNSNTNGLIDYMICAYGPYSASATGGNGWARDFLAGVLTLPATPFFQNIGGENHLAYASTILFGISLLLVVSVYVIYWKGPVLRKRSPFAQQLSAARQDTGGRRVSSLPGVYGSRANSLAGQGGPVSQSRRGSVLRGSRDV